jgi:hypothetical protein
MKNIIKSILLQETKRIFEERQKWDDDTLRDEALKYKTKEEFRLQSPSAYGVANRKGKDFFNSITKHLTRKTKWNEDSLKNEASKYNSLIDFRNANKSAYQLAQNIGMDFFNEITSHMDRRRDKWTDDELIQDALKYSDLGDYIKNSTGDSVARKRGKDFYRKITSHMTRKNAEIYIYSEDELKLEALKYKTRNEFNEKNGVAYRQALNKGKDFYESIVQHMGDIGDIKKRMIYAFLFPNNIIYVGLTYKLEIREKQHLQIDDTTKKSPVKNYIKETGIQPQLIKLTDYIPYDEAQKKEDEFIKKFTNEGYTLLNTQKAGSLGAGINKWTKNKLKQLALTYTDYTKFTKEQRSAYTTAKNMGILDDITSHMVKSGRIKWTEDMVKQIALAYNDLNSFYYGNSNAYQAAIRFGILDDITSHMKRKILKKRVKKYTKETILNILQDYTSYQDFYTNNHQAYVKAIELGLIDDIKKYYK